MPVDAVVLFLRERGHDIKHPEILGLPVTTGRSERTIDRAQEQLTEALVNGDKDLCRGILVDVYLANHRLSTICDQVICRAFQSIGNLWSCGDVEVFEERRACEICISILHDLKRLIPSPDKTAPSAMGGTTDGDPYTLANGMVELVLREVGWNATSLGCGLPFDTLRSAIEKHRPQLFWLSVSVIDDTPCFVNEMNQLFEAARSSGTALAIGGRAIESEIRQNIRYTSFCDLMEHMEEFASTLRESDLRSSKS